MKRPKINVKEAEVGPFKKDQGLFPHLCKKNSIWMILVEGGGNWWPLVTPINASMEWSLTKTALHDENTKFIVWT